MYITKVQQALNSLMANVNGTCIAIAHRLSTIMDSDLIAVIKDKTVKEVGTHAELVTKPEGHYAELSKLSGMGNGDDEEEEVQTEGAETALHDAMKLVQSELERDPGSALLSKLSEQLRVAGAYTNAERRRLKELQKTYEHALQEYHESHDGAELRARVEKAKARQLWFTASDTTKAKLRFLSVLRRPNNKKEDSAFMSFDDAKADLLGPPPTEKPQLRRQATV